MQTLPCSPEHCRWVQLKLAIIILPVVKQDLLRGQHAQRCSICVQDGSECTFSPKTEEHSRAILAASTNSDRLQQSSSDQVSKCLITCPPFSSHADWQ